MIILSIWPSNLWCSVPLFWFVSVYRSKILLNLYHLLTSWFWILAALGRMSNEWEPVLGSRFVVLHLWSFGSMDLDRLRTESSNSPFYHRIWMEMWMKMLVLLARQEMQFYQLDPNHQSQICPSLGWMLHTFEFESYFDRTMDIFWKIKCNHQ